MEAWPMKGKKILFPRAAAGRELIPDELTRRGAAVTLVEAYRKIAPEESRGPARELFPAEGAPQAEAVVFSSSSTARHLAELLGPDYRRRLQGVVLAAIGPVTRRTLEGLGLPVAVEAAEASSAEMARALAEYWHARAT